MKDTGVNTSSEVILFDNNVMETINKLKNQHKCADLQLNNIKDDHSKNRINALSVIGKIKTNSQQRPPVIPTKWKYFSH